MARIKILQGVAGDDFSWIPGEVVDLPEEEAVKWADGYRAERVDPPPASKPEPKAEEKPKAPAKRAAPKPPETTAERSRGGGRARSTEAREG